MRNLLINYGYKVEPRNLAGTIYRCYLTATDPINQIEGMHVVFIRSLVNAGIAKEVDGVVNFVGRKTHARKRELCQLHLALNNLHLECVNKLRNGASVLSCDILGDMLDFYENDKIVYNPLEVAKTMKVMLMMRGEPNDTAASL